MAIEDPTDPLNPGATLDLAFPDFDHDPTHGTQLLSLACVALPVLGKLSSPKASVSLALSLPMLAGMSMPKASMNEQSHFPRRKYKVRPARQFLRVQSVPVAVAV